MKTYSEGLDDNTRQGVVSSVNQCHVEMLYSRPFHSCRYAPSCSVPPSSAVRCPLGWWLNTQSVDLERIL